MNAVVLGLGSNRFFFNMEPEQILYAACRHLKLSISDLRISSVYKTSAMYVENQNDFYNMAVMGKFSEEPPKLLTLINDIELRFGRNRAIEVRNGPRTLDIDIELFGNYFVDDENLKIPHPKFAERAFVLVPVLELFQKNADYLKENSFPFSEDDIHKYLKKLRNQRIEKL